MSKAELKRVSDRILDWRFNPAKYVTDLWPQVRLEPFQRVALKALAEPDAHVSIRSGHGVGKSAMDAWAILWFATCFYPFKIPITAPSSTQLQDILHSEVGTWLRLMPAAFRDNLELKKERLELVGHSESCFASFRTARKDKPEALQGFHGKNLLVVIDEASGVDDTIFQVAEGTLSTPGAKVLMTSNPTRRNGYFYNSHHGQRAFWQTLKVGCDESSRVSNKYIDDMSAKYGADSNIYRVRVLGEFPTEDDDAVIPLDLAESARYRDVEPMENVMPVWGLDVARFGNCKTVLAKRHGNIYLGHKGWHKRDTMEVAGLIMFEYENTTSDMRPAAIYVDVIGIGAGVVDRLLELDLPVVGINVGEVSSGSVKFANLRAELWWRAREWLEQRDTKMDDDELIAELCTVTYKFRSNGKLLIESKEDMIGRGLASPDTADAFVLTFSGADRRKSTHEKYQREVRRIRGSRSAWTA